MADEDSLGWQKAPQTPEMFGGLADRLTNIERRIANIESRTVLGTTAVRSDEQIVSGFGITKAEGAIVTSTIPAPSSFSSVVVVAMANGQALWDYSKGGTAGSGDWGKFFSRITVQDNAQSEGSSEFVQTIDNAAGTQASYAVASFGAAPAALLLDAASINGSVTVKLSARTSWPTAFHSDSRNRARLQVVCLFIR